ncbi:MAG: KpsF/GutQ family sugar-phosphate isomerase [Marivibrio sp.]|uniref:KpsF/GutQ family sugar-phosphate isomerase n=1 Tax=Marivibrio sp. TaxID=2039719 RepID=UPI0032ECC964
MASPLPKKDAAAESEPEAAAADRDGQAVRDLEAGRRVLRLEGAALAACADALDGAFTQAVSLLGDPDRSRRSGRVVVTGMGKSGHVGRKIAATFASTGTPSQFVHPAEASHGDLGMITERDAILALSNSGETPELSDVLSYAKRYEIPIVAITSRADSTLARVASAALVLPDQPEAATMGLAPTTSTTMAMALGDALAVALLERKGFTASDFKLFHPGGKLGRQLARVEDLMHRGEEVPLIGPDAPMQDVLLVMTSKHFGCVGIADADGPLQGIITDGDLRRHMSPDLMHRRAGDIMTENPIAIAPDKMASETLALMNGRQITALFVVDRDGRPVGVVHIHDFLRAGVA